MKKGFTLVELLVVVAILGTMSTLVVVAFRGSQSAARDTKRQSDLKQYQNAIEIYANRSNSLYPSHTSATSLDSMCGASELNINGCADDPVPANNYNYISSANRLNYVIWSIMEKKTLGGTNEYFILCSTGKVGRSQTAPTSATCPL